MTQATQSLLTYMQRIEKAGHVGAIFVRSGANFLVSKVENEAELPGIWVCTGAYGNPIVINEDEIVAVVEHESAPSR